MGVAQDEDDAEIGGAVLPERALSVVLEDSTVRFELEGIAEGSSVVLEAIASYAITLDNQTEQAQTFDIMRVEGFGTAEEVSEMFPMFPLTLEPGASETFMLTLSEDQKGLWALSSQAASSWLVVN